VLPDLAETSCTLRTLHLDETAANLHTNIAAQATFSRLREWGARVWTFPEVLLGPDKPIRICWKEDEAIHWYELEKQHFPGFVWDDEAASMEMVRNYNNTALTRLEFVKIALNCLLYRQKRGLQWHFPGDLSYVLMGFLRVRPSINKYDSSLQAFARYSSPYMHDPFS